MLNPVTYYRIARWAYLHHIPLIPRLLSVFAEMLFHCYLPYSAEIGQRFQVGYRGVGVVVHARARIGEDSFLGPGVVIGGRSETPGVPIIGNAVYIAAGEKVLGDITIGDGAVIGANAVVIKSVDPRTIVAGVPARVIRQNINSSDYTGWPPPTKTAAARN